MRKLAAHAIVEELILDAAPLCEDSCRRISAAMLEAARKLRKCAFGKFAWINVCVCVRVDCI